MLSLDGYHVGLRSPERPRLARSSILLPNLTALWCGGRPFHDLKRGLSLSITGTASRFEALPYGSAMAQSVVSGSQGIVLAADADDVYATDKTTVAIALRWRDTTNRATNAFGYSAGSSDRAHAHLPFSDGNIYWDFGNATAGSGRLSVALGGKNNTQLERFVFIAGPTKGREIWRNGRLLANNAAATATRATTSASFIIGNSSTASDLIDIYLLGVWNEEWPDTKVRSWSRFPFQLLERSQRIYLSAAVGGAVNTVSQADGMYVNDQILKQELRRLSDGFFIRDDRIGQRSHLQQDLILVVDALFAQAVRQPYALDSILVQDDRISAHGKVRQDDLLLNDARTSQRHHQQTDGLLLSDVTVKSLLKILQDGLLIFDQAISSASQLYSVTATDGLYLQDYVLRQVLKIVHDAILLFDQATTSVSTGQAINTVVATDFMLLGDDSVRSMFKSIVEFLLIGDEAHRVLVRQRAAIDGAYLNDLVARAMSKYALDSLVVEDASQRLRWMLLSEGVEISDTASTSLIVIGAEFLVFARLQMIRYLGIGIRTVDFLGRRIAITKSRVMQ